MTPSTTATSATTTPASTPPATPKTAATHHSHHTSGPRASIADDLAAGPGILSLITAHAPAFAARGFGQSVSDSLAAALDTLAAASAAAPPRAGVAPAYMPADRAALTTSHDLVARILTAIRTVARGKAGATVRREFDAGKLHATSSAGVLFRAIERCLHGMTAHPDVVAAAYLTAADQQALEAAKTTVSEIAARAHETRAANVVAGRARVAAHRAVEQFFSQFKAAAGGVFAGDPDGLEGALLLIPKRRRKKAPTAAAEDPAGAPAAATPALTPPAANRPAA